MADEIDFTRQPPALGGQVPRVFPETGLPTQFTEDQEAAEQAFLNGTVVDLQTKINTVQSATNANTASITSEIVARTSADAAIASDLNTVSTAVAGNTASLEVLQASYNGIATSYSVTGTINGVSGGFVLTGVAKNDGTASYGIEFSVNDFRITDPAYMGGMSGNVLAYSTTLGGFVFGVPVQFTNTNIAPAALYEFSDSTLGVTQTVGAGATTNSARPLVGVQCVFHTDGKDACLNVAVLLYYQIVAASGAPVSLDVDIYVDSGPAQRIFHASNFISNAGMQLVPVPMNLVFSAAKGNQLAAGLHQLIFCTSYTGSAPGSLAYIGAGSSIQQITFKGTGL